MTNTDIIVNLATMIAEQRLEISELKTEVEHLHHELIATMSEADTPQTETQIETQKSNLSFEKQTDCGIGCSRCESRYDCYDRNMPHAVRCNNYGKITDEP